MQINRTQPHGFFRASPPRLAPRKTETEQPSADSVDIRQAVESPGIDEKKLWKLVGLGLMAAGRMVSMVPGGGAAAPVICAGEIQQAQEGSRLEQVLTCALVESPHQLTGGQDRASYAWEGLRAGMGGDMNSLKERPGDGTITAWPYGQVMTAALNQARLSGDYTDFNRLVEGLEKYQHPDGGYSPSPGKFGFHGNRFMDDNAWIGLVFVQAAQQQPEAGHLEKAKEIADFLIRSRNPDGGLIWEEGNKNPSYNTATFGPSIELSLRLYQLTGEEKYRVVAEEMTTIMDRELRQPNGLYHDNLDLKTGKVEPTVWSYNQGTPVGAHLLWYEITGDVTHLDLARQTAQSAMRHFGEEGLWKQPPAFNAIFLRNLMRLDDPSVETYTDKYLNRAWSEALDPRTGLFNKEGHGMGSYEGRGNVSTIDQAALTQLLALQSWSSADRAIVS
ncbi:MAG: glycoside hydrolase family 76 protein [Vulcanimicrobiota bacterium]